MPPHPTIEIEARVLRAIGEVDAASWNACTGGDPFVSYQFLRCLEDTGCAVPERGWAPRHLILHDAAGVVAAAPAYLKDHSFGEYVFDWAWADAYRRLGLEYYPKLQCCVPFTPATGPRLLVRDGAPVSSLRRALLSGLVEVARGEGASSLHVTFPTESERALGTEAGLVSRSGVQYHWHNRGYGSFDDFLGALLGRKKRQIVRERREASSQLAIETLRGSAIGTDVWSAFFGFYRDTIARKWGQVYLTREFFEALGATMGDRVALVVARDGGRIVAAALNLIGTDTLYGRYWGACVDVPFLHFELCYYRAIELALELGLARVEAGAQGEHKIARGYVPVETHSLHWIADPRLSNAIEDFVGREREAIRAEIAGLTSETPYRDLRSAGPRSAATRGEID